MPLIRALTAIDARYLPFAAALATTLAEHRVPGTHVELNVLHAGDVGAVDRHRLEACAPGIEIVWRVIGDTDYARHGLRMTGLLARPTYFRCLAPDLLTDADRALYLDADTLVLDDLLELYDTDLRGSPTGAVVDWLPRVRDAIAPWSLLGLRGDAPYFNAGVLVLDLTAWRESDAGGAALHRCLADADYLNARGIWPQHDQYGLNVVFHERWHQLAKAWNHFSELPANGARIVHFVGNGKPWNPKCEQGFRETFYKAVDRTPWAGWRHP